MADIRYLRAAATEPARVHFRKGDVGGWVTELSPELQNAFRQHEPLLTLVQGMGYAFERPAPIVPFSYRSINPLAGEMRFADGSSIATIIVRAYLERAPASFERWPTPTSTAGGSFFRWLNDWYANDKEPAAKFPVTNLAQVVYEYRRDIQSFAPDHRGKDWPRFCPWSSVSSSP